MDVAERLVGLVTAAARAILDFLRQWDSSPSGILTPAEVRLARN
jgi:hypothetical protein